MTALQDLDRLLADPRRHAVLPREVAGSPSAVHRALKRRCADRTLQRVGTGIYARSTSKLFAVVPEILPKLGYKVTPPPRITNLNFKHGGAVWHIDRPFRRLIIKHGVKAAFRAPGGKLYRARPRRVTPLHEPPSRRETELTFCTADRCHSYARAEKDLITWKALHAWEGFRHPDATLALDGDTNLDSYCRMLRRFSEDIVVRVILADELERGPAARRVAAFREVSRAFAEHVQATLPFLQPTSKGRFHKRGGRFESHVFNYRPRTPHPHVPSTLRLELVQQPNRLPLDRVDGLTRREVQVVDLMEICMGKWQALRERLPGRPRDNPALVRHTWDLAAIRSTLTLVNRIPPPALAEMIGECRGPALTAALRELHDPYWQDAFTDYADLMGARPISDSLRQYADPTWPTLRRWSARVALNMDLVPSRDRDEVEEMSAGRWTPHQPGQTRGGRRDPSR